MAANNILFATNHGRVQGQPRDFDILLSAARTETTSSAFFDNPGAFKGVRIYVEVTASADTPSVTFSIQARNRRPATATYHTLLTSAAVTGVSSNCYEVYPGDALVANVVASRHIGTGFRVTATHSDADSITYRIVGEWLH